MTGAATSPPHDDVAAPEHAPAGSYGRGVGLAAAAVLLTGAAAIALAWTVPLGDGARSVLFGAGLVALSGASTVLVSAGLFRVAPAATAPALAGLYLVKVLVFGWLLVVPGTPHWLVPAPFVGAVLPTLVAVTVATALLARRVANREASARPTAPEPGPSGSGKDQS